MVGGITCLFPLRQPYAFVLARSQPCLPGLGGGGVPGRGGADLAFEVAGEVRLVMEAGGGRNVGDRLSGEEQAAGRVDSAADEVSVGWQAKCRGEAANEGGGLCAQLSSCFPQGHTWKDATVEQVAKLGGQPRGGRSGRLV